MIEVKRFEPEYDEIDLFGNDLPICPYCKSHNDTSDLDSRDEETTETECDHCGKVFMYTPRVSVTYDTIPYENWYMDKRERLINHKNKLESIEIKSPWTETSIKRLTQGIEELDKEAERILGEQP